MTLCKQIRALIPLDHSIQAISWHMTHDVTAHVLTAKQHGDLTDLDISSPGFTMTPDQPVDYQRSVECEIVNDWSHHWCKYRVAEHQPLLAEKRALGDAATGCLDSHTGLHGQDARNHAGYVSSLANAVPLASCMVGYRSNAH